MTEEEIRNRGLFNRYLKMVEKDAKRIFNLSSFLKVACPACGSRSADFEFKKNNFSYVSCEKCATLFTNPRPPAGDLARFYSESASARFWVNDFFKPVAEARRTKIFRPRAEYVKDTFMKKSKGLIGDIGAGFGIFLEELARFWPSAGFLAIEPSPEQAKICRGKGLEVRCSMLEDIKGFDGQFDLLTAFELLEHVFDPGDFLRRVRTLLKPGGHFLMTTLNGQGFDIQLVWERSKGFSPPLHMNFLNPRSITRLFERTGFDVVEVSTPGKLDWDIVEGMIKKENTHPGRFWELFAREGSEKGKKELQDWIATNALSSHMRLVAKRRAHA